MCLGRNLPEDVTDAYKPEEELWDGIEGTEVPVVYGDTLSHEEHNQPPVFVVTGPAFALAVQQLMAAGIVLAQQPNLTNDTLNYLTGLATGSGDVSTNGQGGSLPSQTAWDDVD